MSKTLRRLTPLWFIALACGATTVSGMQPPQAGQDPAGQTQMTNAGAPVPPDRVAMDAALRVTKAADRLAALDRIRRDFPQSPLLTTIDAEILAGVLQMQDSADAASEVIDRWLALIPATASADPRLAAAAGPASQLITRKVLLDRAEQLLTDATKGPLGPEARARGRYELGRLYAARGEMDRAEAEYRAAATNWAPAVSALVTLLVGKDERSQAETFLLGVVKATPVNLAALTSLTNFYRSEPAKAEAILRDAVDRDPRLPSALLQLARLESQRGDDTAALDHYLRAATMAYLRGADGEAMRTLYTKAHGNAAGLEDDINARYLKLPKAPKPAPYTPTPRRTDRLVVLEMFTGSACPPCVAADLAMDAALDRYPPDGILALAYHQHIPGPDPMTTTEGDARRQFYGVNGVPTLHIDGAIVAGPDGGTFGGGGRDRMPEVFEKYTGQIETELESASEAVLAVRAAMAGDKVTVTADVTKLPAGAGDLRLHLVLAERELLFGGENGIRSHAMVVRGVAGAKGLGLPLAGTGSTTHTFDLAAIRADITANLAAEIANRKAGSSGGSFAAEDHAMTRIDPAHLIVVAFVQTPAKKVLQAARADVVAPAATKGGSAPRQ
jgi:tetratricopeptide (TPR) repeat protein